MIFKDYYKILELETSRVSLDEIKSAYRVAVKKHHPDTNLGDSLAEEKIKDINEAYRVLSNSSSKRKYDRMWNANVGKQKRAFEESGRDSNSIFSDFFNMFFGNVETENDTKTIKKGKIAVKGENVETEIKTNIEEAFYGSTKKISLRTVEGKMKTFTVSVPAGIRDGEKIRLIGQGKPGQNGGKNGDLFIKINIEDDNKFVLKGYDLYTDLLLTPWEAALGTRTKINSIDDETQIYIPQGIQSGEVIRIPGKGYKDGQGSRGDLVAEVKIMVPKQLTEQEKEIFENLNKISKFNPRTI
jgi:curved DNA-binding protein